VKESFIGSSKEGLEQATQVATIRTSHNRKVDDSVCGVSISQGDAATGRHISEYNLNRKETRHGRYNS